MKKFLRRFNWISFLSTVALVVIGALVLASAGDARGADTVFASLWKKMVATAGLGFVLYFTFAILDYRKVLDYLAYPSYAGAIFFLLLVLAVGSVQFGGRRWLWFFQPSEISKLCVICCLAQLFGPAEERFRGQFGFKGFLAAAAIIAVPSVLILLEPDLGTTLTLVPAVGAMMLVAGVWRKGLVVMLSAGTVVAAAILLAVSIAEDEDANAESREKAMSCVKAILKDHQVKRVKTFVTPGEDELGAGYNLHQAMMTIGSGGVNGRGYMKGEAVRRRLLPPMGVMNDFIFCVWAEEMGYRWSLALLGLFAALCGSVAWTAVVAGDGRGVMMAAGMATLLFAHVFINIGMSLGLVPITGLPLPFLSLGRTFLVTIMCGLGIVQSISIHREEKTE